MILPKDAIALTYKEIKPRFNPQPPEEKPVETNDPRRLFRKYRTPSHHPSFGQNQWQQNRRRQPRRKLSLCVTVVEIRHRVNQDFFRVCALSLARVVSKPGEIAMHALAKNITLIELLCILSCSPNCFRNWRTRAGSIYRARTTKNIILKWQHFYNSAVNKYQL